MSMTPQRLMVLDRIPAGADLDAVVGSLGNTDLVLLDCAGGVGEERTRARWAISKADQVLVVTRPELAGARRVAEATSHALEGSHADCRLVINRAARRGVPPSQSAFSSVAALGSRYLIPEDRHFAAMLNSMAFRVESMGRRIRQAIKDMAADIGEGLR
jgi:MinD-like ATPase involved in chromosome partitioning or flagellar assembly